MSALVVCVERVPSPAIFRRRTVISSSSAAVTGCTSCRVHFVSLTPELAKPASKRTGTTSTADADIWILSGNQSKCALLESESIYMVYSSSIEENRRKSFLKCKINKQIFIFFSGIIYIIYIVIILSRSYTMRIIFYKMWYMCIYIYFFFLIDGNARIWTCALGV